MSSTQEVFDGNRPRPRSRGGDLRYLLRSLIFLCVLATFAVLAREPILSGFQANVLLNSIIVSVLLFGVIYALRSMIDVLLDARAATRVGDLVEEALFGQRPLRDVNEVLLSPMQRGVGELLHTVQRALAHSAATVTLPYLLDTVASRGEDRRALVRYLTTSLVLLGLIGTFLGLLVTIGGVHDVLGSLSVEPGANALDLLTGLRERLREPLAGMGIAFSSSLFGLLSSLVLAFLELQLFHAQNSLQGRLELLVVSDLVPLWGREHPQTGQPAAAQTATVSPQYVNALIGDTGERLEKLVDLLESQNSRENAAQRVTEQLGLLSERIESLRETLEHVEKDRTIALRNELRVIARTLGEGDAPP